MVPASFWKSALSSVGTVSSRSSRVISSTSVSSSAPASSRTRSEVSLSLAPYQRNAFKGASVSLGKSRPLLAFFSASTTGCFFTVRSPSRLCWPSGRPSFLLPLLLACARGGDLELVHVVAQGVGPLRREGGEEAQAGQLLDVAAGRPGAAGEATGKRQAAGPPGSGLDNDALAAGQQRPGRPARRGGRRRCGTPWQAGPGRPPRPDRSGPPGTPRACPGLRPSARPPPFPSGPIDFRSRRRSGRSTR